MKSLLTLGFLFCFLPTHAQVAYGKHIRYLDSFANNDTVFYAGRALTRTPGGMIYQIKKIDQRVFLGDTLTFALLRGASREGLDHKTRMVVEGRLRAGK